MTKELKQKLKTKIWYWLCYVQDLSDEDLEEYSERMTAEIIKLLEENS